MRILLIEDDQVLADTLRQVLTQQHYVIDWVEDGMAGFDYAESAEYDLILMDVGLPQMNGITLCQKLRSSGSSTPILLMTGRDATDERIRGLDAGADDYLIKPLDLAELQARVRALLRRGVVAPATILQIGSLQLDPSTCRVSYGTKILSLTPKEYSLLELLMRNPTRVFSRGQILQHLWTFDDPPLEESVKAHVKGLRQKLKAVGAADWIENVYGIGYRLREPVEPKNEVLQASQPSASHVQPPPEPTFHQAVDQLWNQYRGLMEQRLSALQQLVLAIRDQALTVEIRQTAAGAAHKLAGVLGMFDRDAGTVLARQVENLLLEEGDLSPQQVQQLENWVGELEDLLNLEAAVEGVPETALLLLVDSDTQLSQELGVLGRSHGLVWKQVNTLEAAQAWARSQPVSLVVLAIETLTPAHIQFMANLGEQTPPVPVLVLAAADSLLDRVTVARAGGQSFLVKPVSANQVWEAATQLLQRHAAQTTRVLVVDDDPIFLEALRQLITPWGMTVSSLDNPLHFWEVLNVVTPDLLILDVEMPGVSGIELCQTVRLDPIWQSLPILFLTAHKGSSTVQQVFAAGADDFIIKPVVGPELLARITNRLERHRLLQTLATQDPVTGVANFPHSSRKLEALLRQALTTNQPLCVVVFKLTDLEHLNTHYGHAAGNLVLQRWGQILQTLVRADEILGYWGNGEFMLGLNGQQAEVEERLVDVLKTLRCLVFTAPQQGDRFQAAWRFAIAECPTHGTTLADLWRWQNSLTR